VIARLEVLLTDVFDDLARDDLRRTVEEVATRFLETRN